MYFIKKDKKAVSTIVGALMLILVVIIAVSGLAVMISQFQKDSMNREAAVNAVKNEKLEIIKAEPVFTKNNLLDNISIYVRNMDIKDTKIIGFAINDKYLLNNDTDNIRAIANGKIYDVINSSYNGTIKIKGTEGVKITIYNISSKYNITNNETLYIQIMSKYYNFYDKKYTPPISLMATNIVSEEYTIPDLPHNITLIERYNNTFNGSIIIPNNKYNGTIEGYYNGTIEGYYNGTINNTEYNGTNINYNTNNTIVFINGTLINGTLNGNLTGHLTGIVNGTYNSTIKQKINGNLLGNITDSFVNGSYIGIISCSFDGTIYNETYSLKINSSNYINYSIEAPTDIYGVLNNGVLKNISIINCNFNGNITGNITGKFNGTIKNTTDIIINLSEFTGINYTTYNNGTTIINLTNGSNYSINNTVLYINGTLRYSNVNISNYNGTINGTITYSSTIINTNDNNVPIIIVNNNINNVNISASNNSSINNTTISNNITNTTISNNINIGSYNGLSGETTITYNNKISGAFSGFLGNTYYGWIIVTSNTPTNIVGNWHIGRIYNISIYNDEESAVFNGIINGKFIGGLNASVDELKYKKIKTIDLDPYSDTYTKYMPVLYLDGSKSYALNGGIINYIWKINVNKNISGNNIILNYTLHGQKTSFNLGDNVSSINVSLKVVDDFGLVGVEKRSYDIAHTE